MWQFRIFYGDSEILYDLKGVVLSVFHSMDKDILTPIHKSIRHLYAWLIRDFKIDPEVQKMTISIVGNRVRDGVYWEVYPFWEDSVWKRYLQDVVHRD